MKYNNIVILTGAGISAESGIPTYRDEDGLWTKYDPDKIATANAFKKYPESVHGFVNSFRQLLRDSTITFNAAHTAIAQFQRNYPGTVTLITQNVDDLHSLAGSPEVIHMHGNINQSRCITTGNVWQTLQDVTIDDKCPCCHVIGNCRPNMVLFHEAVLMNEHQYQMIEKCDLFISIGTSGEVAPASHFAYHASNNGAHTVELNLQPTGNPSFNQFIIGKATEVVPEYLNNLY